MIVHGFFRTLVDFSYNILNGYQVEVVNFTLTFGIIINVINCFVFKWYVLRKICKVADAILFSLSSFYLAMLGFSALILGKFLSVINPIITDKQIISLLIVFLISQVVRNFIVRKSR